MIAVDTNILFYAHRTDSPFHVAARRCVTALAEGSAAWAIPWHCLHEFIGIVTHPRIYNPPTSLVQALDQVDAWIATPTLVLLAESDRYWSQLKTVLAAGRIAGPGIHDARVAALCQEHGVRELWSSDRDFGRFPKLNVVNPLLE